MIPRNTVSRARIDAFRTPISCKDVLRDPLFADDAAGQHVRARAGDVDLAGADTLGQKGFHLTDTRGERPRGVRRVRR